MDLINNIFTKLFEFSVNPMMNAVFFAFILFSIDSLYVRINFFSNPPPSCVIEPFSSFEIVISSLIILGIKEI